MLFKRMKKLPVLLLAALLLGSAFAFVIAACGGEPVGNINADPIADDFNIGTLSFTYDGQPKTVSITPKEGKSQGAVTIHYEGIAPTVYSKATGGPSAAGTYAVTFDVAAAPGFNAASGLSAGTLTIGSNVPTLADFNISGLSAIIDGQPHAVNIQPIAGKSQGAITIYYEGISPTVYTKSTTAPSAAGSYAVTFDVAADGEYEAATGLNAGELVIQAQVDNPETPIAVDFNIGTLAFTYDGSPKEVSISPKTDKSGGAITTWYTGTSPTSYSKSETAPTDAGTYAVTFDIAEAFGFSGETNLEAGTLVISPATPVVTDFIITGVPTTAIYAGENYTVNITAPQDKTQGQITIYYEGQPGTTYTKSTTAPSVAGEYAVTFDVAASSDGNWNAQTGLSAGSFTIIPLPIPTAGDFDITGLDAVSNGQPKAVTIEPRQGKSNGTITTYYEGISPTVYTKSTTAPSTAGSYAVTFDVALDATATPNWDAVTGLIAGTLDIETETNYLTGGGLTWTVSNPTTPLTLGLQPGSTTESINLNWYSSGAPAGKVAQVRFVKGTFAAGTKLLTPTGTAAAAGTSTQHKVTVTGLKPGSSYQYAVSSDGTTWSDVYDFKVPAATGPFKFAVIADPQLHATTWDALNRYSPQTNTTGQYVTSVNTNTTGAGWLETMVKIVAKGVSFIASGGDQVDASGGNETEYNLFFNPPGLRSLPFAPVSGNHDNHLHFNYHYNVPNITETGTSGAEVGRNYYYKYNNILFVVLDTAPYPGSQSAAAPYITRYRAVLTAATNAHPASTYDWLIVQHHKSTASVADHLADRDIQYYVEAGFETLMSEFNVDFVLAGHDHVYARSYPLSGRGGGKVSVPNKTFNPASGSTWHNPGAPVYLTFTTGSGLKYYAVRADPTSVYGNTLYVKDNASYPYLGEITGDDNSTQFGSSAYLSGNYLPVSNAAYVQPYVPSYGIVEVNGRTITFSTYAIATVNGQVTGATQGYNFNADVPYDVITVTKN